MATFRYCGIGKFLVCIDQPVLRALRHLGLGYRRNRLAAIGMPVAVARAAIRTVVRNRLGMPGRNSVTELPVFGEIGLQVHGGCKLFDLDREEVTKVFDPDTPQALAAQEITASRQASQVPAAPRFIEADTNLAWYREEYVRGIHATDPVYRQGKGIREFYPAVEDCLLDLVAAGTILQCDAASHFAALADDSFRERWLAAGQADEPVDQIASYVNGLRDWLAGQPQPGRLQLVPVHGDFSLVNAIATDTGLRFIDWEGIAPGGVYDDIFNFLFVERYYGRATDTFMDDVTTFLNRYGSAVRERFPELRDATEIDVTFARRQYYLERLSLLLDRNASDNLCKVVLNSIRMFEDFDREAGAA